MYFDQWMRGDPYRLWGETIGHSTKKDLPTAGDVWRSLTSGAVDPNIVSHVTEFFTAHGFVWSPKGIVMKEPHQTMEEFQEGAQMAVAVVADSLAALQRQQSSSVGGWAAAEAAAAAAAAAAGEKENIASGEEGRADEALAALNGGLLSQKLLAMVQNRPGDLFFTGAEGDVEQQMQQEPTTSEEVAGAAGEAAVAASSSGREGLSFPAGLEYYDVEVLEPHNATFCVRNRQVLASLEDLVDVQHSRDFLFPEAPFAFQSGELSFLPLADKTTGSSSSSRSSGIGGGGGALLCVRSEEDPHYAATFQLAPSLLAEVAAEVGVAAGELSADDLGEFLKSQDKTFPLPTHPEKSFGSILVEVLVRCKPRAVTAGAKKSLRVMREGSVDAAAAAAAAEATAAAAAAAAEATAAAAAAAEATTVEEKDDETADETTTAADEIAALAEAAKSTEEAMALFKPRGGVGMEGCALTWSRDRAPTDQ